MIRLKNLMMEKIVSDILFHHTSEINLYKILKTNRIYFSTSLGNRNDNILQTKNKFYYFSTSRIKVGGYSLRTYPGWVNLVMNGRQLGKNFSSVNVDYFRKAVARPRADSLKTPEDKTRYLMYDENEERIISTKPFISGVKKFINEIHILLSEEYMRIKVNAFRIIDIEKLANEKKIPIYFYTDENSVKTLNKRKAFTSLKDTFPNLDMDNIRSISYKNPKFNDKYSIEEIENIKLVTSLLQKGINDKLTEKEKKYVSNIYIKDIPRIVKRLETDIDNNRGSFDNKDAVDSIYSLTRVMRRLKLKNITQVINWIVKTHKNI